MKLHLNYTAGPDRPAIIDGRTYTCIACKKDHRVRNCLSEDMRVRDNTVQMLAEMLLSASGALSRACARERRKKDVGDRAGCDD